MAQYFWLPFPLLASGDPQNKKALEQEACRVGLLRFLQNLNDDATMRPAPTNYGHYAPSGNRAPTCPHVPGFEVQSRPQPQSRRPTGTHKGGYQHAAFDGGSSARALPRLPPKNSLGRCARTLRGPALEQEALAGVPPKKFLGRCARKLWGPAETGSPCRDASQKTL